MTKIKKLLKSLLCACVLLGGLVFNPMNANAAKEETVTPYAAARSMEIPHNTLVAFPAKIDGYALNYVFYYVEGTYVYNTSSSGNYVSNVNLLLTKINSRTATTPTSTYGNGIYQVTSLTPQTYEAGSNFRIVINYKLKLKLLSSEDLETAYNSKTITGIQG